MASDRPTGSVSGTGGWDWNRLMENRKRTQDPTQSPGPSSGRIYGDSSSAVLDVDPVARAALERGRAGRELRSVITHYERLVSEKDRRLDELTEELPGADSRRNRLLRGLDRVIPGR